MPFQVERVCSGCGTQLHVSTVKAEVVEEINGSSQKSQPSTKRRRRSHGEANTDSESAGYDTCLTFDAKLETKRVTRNSARLSAN